MAHCCWLSGQRLFDLFSRSSSRRIKSPAEPATIALRSMPDYEKCCRAWEYPRWQVTATHSCLKCLDLTRRYARSFSRAQHTGQKLIHLKTYSTIIFSISLRRSSLHSKLLPTPGSIAFASKVSVTLLRPI